MALLSSVRKALKILETFSANQPELGVTEISRILNSHKSSIARILTTLVSEGFVEKSPHTSKYRLGLKLADLGSRVLGRYDLHGHADPYMEALARELGEIIHLSVLDKHEIVYIDKKGEGQTLTVATKIGGRNPAHASAMGKILLSGLSQKELADLLAIGPLVQCTVNTITDVPKLLGEIEQVRKQGFAVDDEESFPGIRCVAAPVYDSKGKPIAAISATVPTQRMGKQRMNEIREKVVKAARLISERIGMSGLGG